jgi:hypothetical protein
MTRLWQVTLGQLVGKQICIGLSGMKENKAHDESLTIKYRTAELPQNHPKAMAQ